MMRCVAMGLAVVLWNLCVAVSIFAQPTLVLEGVSLEKQPPKSPQEYEPVQESLLIKEGRVYIHVILNLGTKANLYQNRYRVVDYLLPENVQYNAETKQVLYLKDGKEIELGRSKKFAGLMPYVALNAGVKILSTPFDAKLVVYGEPGEHEEGLPRGMEEVLEEKCTQCHVLEYIYSKKQWSEEDSIHIFSRLRHKGPIPLSEEEQVLIDKFKAFQRNEISAEEVAKFRELRAIAAKDMVSVAEGVFENNCTPCHTSNKSSELSVRYTRKRCASIVERMKEKDPTLFLDADADTVATNLWKIKLRPK